MGEEEGRYIKRENMKGVSKVSVKGKWEAYSFTNYRGRESGGFFKHWGKSDLNRHNMKREGYTLQRWKGEICEVT